MTIDKETRQFKFAPIFIYKSLWDFSKKKEYNLILQEWQMTFICTVAKVAIESKYT